MRLIKYIIVFVVLFFASDISPAASWDIGAVQLEGSATDIGAVQASAAIGAGGQVIFVNIK